MVEIVLIVMSCIVLFVCAAGPLVRRARVSRDLGGSGYNLPAEFRTGEWHVVPPPSARELRAVARREARQRRQVGA
jgi:hypothetical protein